MEKRPRQLETTVHVSDTVREPATPGEQGRESPRFQPPRTAVPTSAAARTTRRLLPLRFPFNRLVF